MELSALGLEQRWICLESVTLPPRFSVLENGMDSETTNLLNLSTSTAAYSELCPAAVA